MIQVSALRTLVARALVKVSYHSRAKQITFLCPQAHHLQITVIHVFAMINDV